MRLRFQAVRRGMFHRNPARFDIDLPAFSPAARLVAVLAAACLLLTVAPTCLARDIYVDNVAGNDTFAGEAPNSSGATRGPCRTIARALRLARRGDRIVLADSGEPYRESITLEGIRHSGLPRNPLIIEGNGAILDGSAPVPEEAWEHHQENVFRFRPSRMSHQQLFLDDLPVERVSVNAHAHQPPGLEPLQWCLFQGHVYFCVEEGKLPTSYELTHSRLPVGVTLFRVEGLQVQNLVVQGFQMDGISSAGGVDRCKLANVVARGNGRAGITVGGASRLTLENCLLGNNGEAQLRAEDNSVTRIEGGELLANTAPAVVRLGRYSRVFISGIRLQQQEVKEDLVMSPTTSEDAGDEE